MNTLNKRNENGFTIIEVVLVLAIAGLIFLMVFIALPALQRGQRDTQRKQDLLRISTQVTNYMSSTRGSAPNDDTTVNNFVRGYLNGPVGGAGLAGDDYTDPDGSTYKLSNRVVPTQPGDIGFYGRSTCNVEDIDTGVRSSTASRDFALTIKLENQKAPYCIDNKS